MRDNGLDLDLMEQMELEHRAKLLEEKRKASGAISKPSDGFLGINSGLVTVRDS